MDWLTDNLWAGWLALAVTLGVAEMFSLDLILIMLAVGAMAGVIPAALGAPLALQVLVAAGTSVATLALIRPTLVKRVHNGPDLQLGHGKLVGKQGLVTERISGLETGRIKVAGEIWSAAPFDDTMEIEAGETVDVIQIKGATAYVHPVPRLDS